jgi:hypothetical protein
MVRIMQKKECRFEELVQMPIDSAKVALNLVLSPWCGLGHTRSRHMKG